MCVGVLWMRGWLRVCVCVRVFGGGIVDEMMAVVKWWWMVRLQQLRNYHAHCNRIPCITVCHQEMGFGANWSSMQIYTLIDS